MRMIDADALKEKAFGRRGGLIHTSDIDDMPTAPEARTQMSSADTVSRQAAIGLIRHEIELSRCALDEMDLVGTEREKFAWGLGLLECIAEDIDELPSAQPELNQAQSRIQSSDCISRQAAIDAFCKECYDTDGEICDRDDVCGTVMILKALPSAQPELIRCKDCKNFRRWIDTDITFCDFTEGRVCEDDFCSRAEVQTELMAWPSAQPEYYDYSDIDDVWEFYAEEQDIKLTDGAKQLKDAMWVGYRKGKRGGRAK